MAKREDIKRVINSMILSASGWRGVFASGEESAESEISSVHGIICGAAAFVFAGYLKKKAPFTAHRSPLPTPLILVGTDTRPTGKAIADVVIRVLLSCGCNVRYAGVAAAPEIMAWSKSIGGTNTGFIYISASHNPIGHNGLKFGLDDGGVLGSEESAKLISNFRAFIESEDNITKIENLISSADSKRLKGVYDGINESKTEAKKSYHAFTEKVMFADSMRLHERSLGIVCDFNGSARTVSIDREFFSDLGIKFESINSEPGQIAHRIVPEGDSLEPCRKLLEEAHKRDASFVLGYVPDCDGDRGNLVIWDDAAGKTRALEAQEVFALACTAEFSYLVRANEGKALNKAAVAVNDPTSLRIDRIAEAFGISVFRAEVGEANVVALARKLREDGYTVRILGEGSAGGNITHPSSVRDPINTVLAIVKLLSMRKDSTLAEIIDSLPKFSTTPAYSADAVLRIKTENHAILKDRYQKIFLREWEERKDELKERYGICGWEAFAYNGTAEKSILSSFGEAGRGGLKILFRDIGGKAIAFIWMRGSATEPVFRIMADVQGEDSKFERDLLEWQSRMITEADELTL